MNPIAYILSLIAVNPPTKTPPMKTGMSSVTYGFMNAAHNFFDTQRGRLDDFIGIENDNDILDVLEAEEEDMGPDGLEEVLSDDTLV